jgi:hypothetical protein
MLAGAAASLALVALIFAYDWCCMVDSDFTTSLVTTVKTFGAQAVVTDYAQMAAAAVICGMVAAHFLGRDDVQGAA